MLDNFFKCIKLIDLTLTVTARILTLVCTLRKDKKAKKKETTDAGLCIIQFTIILALEF